MPKLTREQLTFIVADCIQTVSGAPDATEIVASVEKPLDYFGISDSTGVRVLTGLLARSHAVGLPKHGYAPREGVLEAVDVNTRVRDLVAMLLPGHEDYPGSHGGGGNKDDY
ncbi:MAG TPA: hypothetical protein VD968_16570 [Pyrinomonadaceae bacterium]|nr:hypothetical protein [Pyrinomonadaceae bacterium]